MSWRAFIFCDICNPDAVRVIEMRRGSRRQLRKGRRIIDGRMWFDGSDEAARASGWLVTGDGHHACPDCCARLVQRPTGERPPRGVPEAILRALATVASPE